MQLHGEDARGLEELEALIRENFLPTLVGQLQRKFHNLAAYEVVECVLEAVAKVVKRLQVGPITEPRKYLAAAARNACYRAATRRPLLVELEDYHGEPSPSAEDDAQREALLAVLKTEAKRWENSHIRVVTLVYIDVIAQGEAVDSEEVAVIVSQNLGEEVSAVSVRKWKQRGFARLQEFIEGIGIGARAESGTGGRS